MTTTYPAAYPKGGNIADMVGVQMTGKDLVQFRVVQLKAGQSLSGANAQVKQEGFAVAQLYQKTGRRITGGLGGHAGTAGGDAHLLLAEFLGIGIVGAGVFVVFDLLRYAATGIIVAVNLVGF